MLFNTLLLNWLLGPALMFTLACGDREAAAVLVALNSIFQVVMFAVLGWFYLSVLPGWLGLPQTTIATSSWRIAKSVLIFLGIPLAAGYLSRRLGERAKGRAWSPWFTSRWLCAGVRPRRATAESAEPSHTIYL